jgi:hypothetical protein
LDACGKSLHMIFVGYDDSLALQRSIMRHCPSYAFCYEDG